MKTIYTLRGYTDVASYVTMLEDDDFDAACYAMHRKELPFGGFTCQGYAIEEVSEIQVAADSPEYLSARRASAYYHHANSEGDPSELGRYAALLKFAEKING